jgi:hypothetical protein
MMGQIAQRFITLVGCIAASVLLAACSGYDVELKGGVFDAAGLSGLSAKRVEPNMTNRPGIVIPPSTASLPVPGSPPAQQTAAVNGQAFPVNPEDASKVDVDAVRRKHEAFCVKARQRFENGIAGVIERSPWGECHESVLRNFTGQSAWGNKAVGVK